MGGTGLGRGWSSEGIGIHVLLGKSRNEYGSYSSNHSCNRDIGDLKVKESSSVFLLEASAGQPHWMRGSRVSLERGEKGKCHCKRMGWVVGEREKHRILRP